jgi:hypothetical protein
MFLGYNDVYESSPIFYHFNFSYTGEDYELKLLNTTLSQFGIDGKEVETPIILNITDTNVNQSIVYQTELGSIAPHRVVKIHTFVE